MDESCVKLLLEDAFGDTSVTGSEISDTYESQNYNFLSTIDEISKKVPYYLENEKKTHIHRNEFNFNSFGISRAESQEIAKRKSEKKVDKKVDFHNISRYASNQLVTRAFSDLNPEKNYDITLIVGKGIHSQTSTSLTKDVVGKMAKTSGYGPGFIPTVNKGVIKYSLESVATKIDDPKSKTQKYTYSLKPVEINEAGAYYSEKK